MAIRPTERHVSTLDLLAAAGVELGLDFDNTLTLRMPEVLARESLRLYLECCSEDLVRAVKDRVHRRLSVFCGGPFDGQRHGLPLCWSPAIVFHLARARWAAYTPLVTGSARYTDRRLVYCGEATSKKKAQQLAWRDYTRRTGKTCYP